MRISNETIEKGIILASKDYFGNESTENIDKLINYIYAQTKTYLSIKVKYLRRISS